MRPIGSIWLLSLYRTLFSIVLLQVQTSHVMTTIVQLSLIGDLPSKERDQPAGHHPRLRHQVSQWPADGVRGESTCEGGGREGERGDACPNMHSWPA